MKSLKRLKELKRELINHRNKGHDIITGECKVCKELNEKIQLIFLTLEDVREITDYGSLAETVQTDSLLLSRVKDLLKQSEKFK